MRTMISVLSLVLALAVSGQSQATEIDWTKVDAALGKTASIQGEIHRYGIPRSDLKVTLDGVTIKPALALGGWVAFEPMQDGAMIMGDLVLTETEVNPVNSRARRSSANGERYPRCSGRKQDALRGGCSGSGADCEY
jgi:hypothetical protein